MVSTEWFDLIVACALGGLIACAAAAYLWGWIRAGAIAGPALLTWWRRRAWRRRVLRTGAHLSDEWLRHAFRGFLESDSLNGRDTYHHTFGDIRRDLLLVPGPPLAARWWRLQWWLRTGGPFGAARRRRQILANRRRITERIQAIVDDQAMGRVFIALRRDIPQQRAQEGEDSDA
jgi:hypothetical protein